MTRKGKIQTVKGVIDPKDLGMTMTHEHVFIEFPSTMNIPPEESHKKQVYNEPISLKNRGLIYHHGWPNSDDRKIVDFDISVNEIQKYKAAGGGAVVDATSIGIARDPEGLLKVSNLTDIHIIMGAAYYVYLAHPPEVSKMTIEDLAGVIINDVNVGVGSQKIKSGIIGEVGLSHPLHKDEEKVLVASAVAQQETGAPILIHPGRDEKAPRVAIDILKKSGADLSNTIMGHLDRTVFEKDTLLEIAESGCYLEWDLFGQENHYYGSNKHIDMPSDAKRLYDIMWLIEKGYGSKILIAHDVCAKHQLEEYGGWGYSYIPSFIVPRMRDKGYTDEMIDAILYTNPSEALQFTK